MARKNPTPKKNISEFRTSDEGYGTRTQRRSKEFLNLKHASKNGKREPDAWFCWLTYSVSVVPNPANRLFFQYWLWLIDWFDGELFLIGDTHWQDLSTEKVGCRGGGQPYSIQHGDHLIGLGINKGNTVSSFAVSLIICGRLMHYTDSIHKPQVGRLMNYIDSIHQPQIGRLINFIDSIHRPQVGRLDSIHEPRVPREDIQMRSV